MVSLYKVTLSLRLEKQDRIPYFGSDKGLKGTVVNRHGLLLMVIATTVSFKL